MITDASCLSGISRLQEQTQRDNADRPNIKLSKCVYLASMGVKIDMGHNQSKNCENVCVCLSKLNGIQGKLNKTEFCCRFCRICHLGRLPVIIIGVLYGVRKTINWHVVLIFLYHEKVVCDGVLYPLYPGLSQGQVRQHSGRSFVPNFGFLYGLYI